MTFGATSRQYFERPPPMVLVRAKEFCRRTYDAGVCTVCGKCVKQTQWLSYGHHGANARGMARCPHCHSLERQRLAALVAQKVRKAAPLWFSIADSFRQGKFQRPRVWRKRALQTKAGS